jgi:hypothetical protein
MADQVGSGTVDESAGEPAELDAQDSGVEPAEALLSPGKHVPFHGRRVSWVAVTIIIVGFLAGGVGLITGPTWWLFWAGLAVAVVGGILALSVGVFNDWY